MVNPTLIELQIQNDREERDRYLRNLGVIRDTQRIHGAHLSSPKPD